MFKIDLQRILKTYEENLCNKVFHYEISDGKIVDVTFYREQFCHLLGLQHVYGPDRRYLGSAGYDKVKNGKLTVQMLKKHDKQAYEAIKERLVCFDDIYELMQNGSLIGFNIDKVKPKTRIQADFIIFQDDKAHILHLFLRKENDKSNIYAPVSYVVKSLNDKSPKQFIENQKYKKIVNRSVLKNCDN